MYFYYLIEKFQNFFFFSKKKTSQKVEVTFFDLRKQWPINSLLPNDKYMFVSLITTFLNQINTFRVNKNVQPLILVQSK